MSTTFPALAEAEGKLKHRQDELGKIFAEAGDTIDLSKVKSVEGDSKAIAAHITALNTEMSELAEEIKGLREVQRAAETSRNAEPGTEQAAEKAAEQGASLKSFGRMLVESNAGTTLKGRAVEIDMDLKTLFTTSAGWAPEVTRTGKVVDYATRPIQVIDLIPQTVTNQSAVAYMEETTFTNSAAEALEGGSYGESARALTEQSSTVRKVATFLPVTDETFEDEARAEAYVNNRLPFMLRQRLDSQILVGNGTAPNLRGVNNVVGIQTQAKGADPTPDAVYKAIVLVRTTGQAMPDAFVVNPLDWQDVRLLRTADGIYIWGNPSEAGPERIWGLQVAQAQAQTQNTGVVGDFGNFSELAVRRGVEVKVSNSHSTYFVEGKQAIRADLRAALIFYRPTAFCTVTGI